MISFFIERPILANVIAIAMLVLGAVSLLRLPVAQYPQLTPPTIQVTASYPGASALTVQEQVARTIEQQVNGVEGMIYMQSNSGNDGRYVLTVTFAVGTDADRAQVAVQNRVSIAVPSLPPSVQQQGVVTKKKSTAILQIITLSSSNEKFDALFLSNFAGLQLRDRLARLPGVADVSVFGIGQYSMRVWLDAAQMSQRALNPSDIIALINQQNQTVAAGQTGMPPTPSGQQTQLTINVDSSLSTPEQFADLIVNTAADGSITRLKDVARVELGSANYNQGFHLDNRAAGGIAIFQLPNANALQTAAGVRAEMQRLGLSFPRGIKFDIPFDTTRFVRASISEVLHTLLEAGALVLVIILVFLQDWRAMLVPATTVPVTLVGTIAAMAAFGFTINLLTLFALVLCIGIVVDDAIVVVEAVSQRIESGSEPKQAAIEAMRDLLGPIIGITLVLASVFLPAAFIPGITGQMYRQFALVIAAAAVLSGINAVTLKPAQSARHLRRRDPNSPLPAFALKFNRGFSRVEAVYLRLIAMLVSRPGWSAAVAALLIIAALVGFLRIPTGFIPTEDQGYLLVAVQLPDAASLEKTEAALSRIVDISRKIPGVEHVITIAGVSPLDNNASVSNAGLAYVTLQDWSQRGAAQGLPAIYRKLAGELSQIPGVSAQVLPPPPINGLGLSGGFQMQVELTDGSTDYAKLQGATQGLIRAALADPHISAAFTSQRSAVPQIKLTLNAARAESLGVRFGDAYAVIQDYLGSGYANQFPKFGQNFPIFLQADQAYRSDLNAIGRLAVRNQSGAMVPLSAFMDFKAVSGPAVASQYNLMPTAAVNGAAASGFSSGQALAVMESLAQDRLPAGVGFEWTASSYQEKLVGKAVLLVFSLALLLVYLLLAAQYESWASPVPVLLAVPLSLIGPVLTLNLVHLPNNIYVQIGLVLLIALSAKNAILLVEVAHDLQRAGTPLTEAALEGSRRRFRPIVMTSIAFISGVAPLIVAGGAGAAARKSIGITVFTGMLASTVLALAFVPVFFVLTGRLHRPRHSAPTPSVAAPVAQARPMPEPGAS
jgi:hydrophobic/amphiphilic exporter-1 (mainly G- bacteria), HAE1 family